MSPRRPGGIAGGSLWARPRRMRGVPPVVVAAIAVAWALTIVAQTTGKAVLLNHGSLIEGRGPLDRPPPLWLAVLLFVAAWQVMVMAMMLPSSLPMVRLFRAASARLPRPGVSMAAFLGGYLMVWSGFGALAFAQDIGMHRLVDRTPWLAWHAYVIGGTALLLAGAFQFSTLKDRCLTQCRTPVGFLLERYRPGAGAALRFGVAHGTFCVGCCWALMLLMFAAGTANLVWMAPLAALMYAEKVTDWGERLVGPAGVALVVLGVLVLAHPAWLTAALRAA
jgi:predicted metal-binding membrane protein